MSADTARYIHDKLQWLDDLADCPPAGAFRVSTQGHTRRERLRQIGLELCQLAANGLAASDVDRFVALMGDVTACEGRHYVRKLCAQARRFLESLAEAIDDHSSNMRARIRLDALEHVPSSLWQLTWAEVETGSAHLKDCLDELGTSAATDHEDEHQADSAPEDTSQRRHLRQAIRIVKGVVRKLKVRCLQPLVEPVEGLEVVQWLDDVLDTVRPLFAAVDDVVYDLHVGTDDDVLWAKTREVAILGERLIDVAYAFPGTHAINGTYAKVATPDSQLRSWLDGARHSLQRSLDPLIDALPNR